MSSRLVFGVVRARSLFAMTSATLGSLNSSSVRKRPGRATRTLVSVRTQLKFIYAKTGVNSLPQVMSLVMVLPSMS